jgi:nitrite reductase/ring-hydroxylating ferredoxin subunit
VGQMRRFDVAGTAIGVANVSGHLYAFDDRCTHKGCSLAKGQVHGTTVECPCHGSRFDVVTGSVLRGPALQPVRSRLVTVERQDLLVEA